MDEEARGQEQEHEPKISDLEVILILPILLVADAIGILLVIFALDDFGLIELFVGIPLAAYYYAKGLYGTQKISGEAVKKYLPKIVGQFVGELIPYVSALPWYSVIFGVIVWMDRHPELEAVVEKVGSVTSGKGGGAAGGAKGALQTEEKAASEAALATGESGAAAGIASGGALEEGAAESDATKAAEGDTGQPEGAGEAEQKPLTLDERRMDNAIRGRNIEDVMEDVFSPDQILAEIDTSKTTDNVRRFDPDRAMSPKPARQFARKKEQGKEPEKKDKEGEEEGKKKYLTPEQERLQTILEGKYVEEVGKKGLTAEGVMGPSPLSDIGETKGIIDDEEVDLRETA